MGEGQLYRHILVSWNKAKLTLTPHSNLLCHFAHADLQTGPTENPWLSAISSHFGYWTSLDTSLFVLRGLHGLDVRQGTSKVEAANVGLPVASPTTSPTNAAAAAH